MNSTQQNPYIPPEANLQSHNNNNNKIENFPRFSTWGVFGLSIITLGIYYPYWLFTRTKILNQVCDNKISTTLVNIVIAFFIINVVLSFMSGFSPKDADMSIMANIANLLYAIINLYWVFTFRSRLHEMAGDNYPSNFKLGGILTFFLQVLYLQYKINEYIDHSNTTD
jgi:hypothetical protein